MMNGVSSLFSGALAFTSPWLLLALLGLPLLWILLRAVPPTPIRQRFPGITLLLGLKDQETVTARTPWWLLLLRSLAVVAVILGLAGPVLNPDNSAKSDANLPLLVVLDASWASARDIEARNDTLRTVFETASRDGRRVAVLRLSAPEPVTFRTADSWIPLIPTLAPLPWGDQPLDWDQVLGDERFETVWFSDGLDKEGRTKALAALEGRGPVQVFESNRALAVLDPITIDGGALNITVRRLQAGSTQDFTLNAVGTDPSGALQILASETLSFAGSDVTVGLSLSLPNELRARITRFELEGQRHAGAVQLSADSLRRREIALISTQETGEAIDLLSPLYYLKKALSVSSDLITGDLQTVLPANPDVIILADIAQLTAPEDEALLAWAEAGGTLLRFAGPRLAASDVSRTQEHPLMPVRLRAGGRSVGGTMSWGEPRRLAPFDQESPFFGLDVPEEVTVSAQVMAQPDIALSERSIAQLEDGTPLVTRKKLGLGQVILFHVTANAEWSTLPLSGLFVQMLERLSISSTETSIAAEELSGTSWTPVSVLSATGKLEEPGNLAAVDGEVLVTAQPGPENPPGIYRFEDRQIARNVVSAQTQLTPMRWPDHVPVVTASGSSEKRLDGWFLALALVLLCLDIIATLVVSGRLRPMRSFAGVLGLIAVIGAVPEGAFADKAGDASLEVVLAHVMTGDRETDRIARQGLDGLSRILRYRTSVEPGDPVGVNLEEDDLAVYPLLYWPVTPDQPRPSVEAYARLNTYLRTGGMILFDTRDGDIAGTGASSAANARLQALAAPLDIPALEPVPTDHVLTRTFYLLQDFPGRYQNTRIWVEAAPPDAEQVEGMPFRDLNDGVSPVIIGGNDWAGAWAVSDDGRPRFRVGAGYDGERQREIAFRFGVNLVMYVLTGNYKSDQVHVPALLDRLGQ